MTVIRLDAATLAQVQASSGLIFLGDEFGAPLLRCSVSPMTEPDREPNLTDEEWEAIENDPIEMPLEEAWERIKRGETV